MEKALISISILVFMFVAVIVLIPWFVDSVDTAIKQTEGYPLLGVLLLIPNPVEEAILRIIAIGLSIFGIVKIWF